jgi:hypothetical protein
LTGWKQDGLLLEKQKISAMDKTRRRLPARGH